ncbi:MAG: sulfurase [Rhodobacteraceae bacterium]|nr:sulfurase [Paracoccaceae bacterium]
MPALMRTDMSCRVEWLGLVSDRALGPRAQPRDRLELTFDGVRGEAHSGRTRAACTRVAQQYPKGTQIANVRQLSIVSAEELAAIAQDMGLPRVYPHWLGASLVVRGIADFTLLPPSSRLISKEASLVIDMENHPCHLPAREIEAEHPGAGAGFKAAAWHRRGVTAWVERPGSLELGAVMHLHVPAQPSWPGWQRAAR